MLRPRILVTSLALVSSVGVMASCTDQPSPADQVTTRTNDLGRPAASSDPRATLIESATTCLEHFYSGDHLTRAYELFTVECKQSLSLDQCTELSEGVQGQEPYMVESVSAEVNGPEGTVQFT